MRKGEAVGNEIAALDKLVAEGHEALEKIGRSLEKASVYAAQFGGILIDCRKSVAHGEWERWLRATFNIGQNQAWKYMEASRLLAADPNHHSGDDLILNRVRKGRLQIELPSVPKHAPEPKGEAADPSSPIGALLARTQGDGSVGRSVGDEPVEDAEVVDGEPVEDAAWQAALQGPHTEALALAWAGRAPAAIESYRRCIAICEAACEGF